MDAGSITAVVMFKVQVAEGGKWICDKCRSERLRVLDETLQNALLQIDNLTRKDKALEEQIGSSWKGSWQAGYDAGSS